MPLEYLYPIKATCPYCGFENTLSPKIITNSYTPIVVTCDYEEGGCDKPFGVKFRMTVQTEIFIMERSK